MDKAKKSLVIVESPTKVKKIGQYLGKNYKVMASMGHVRDLPAKAAEIPAKYKKESWSSLGVNVDEDFSPIYVVSPMRKKLVKDLKEAAKDIDELIIATDLDREGESIGWHLIQLLGQKNIPVKRMVFAEITPEAIKKAAQNMKDLNINLVSAQETRRVLDRLYGYTLSPLLWKKIQRGLSAGRVQSVAVRLLVLRERERMAFCKSSFFGLKSLLNKKSGQGFTTQLVKIDNKRVASGKDFDSTTGELKNKDKVVLLNEDSAALWFQKLEKESWTVSNIESKSQVRNPYAPFITSTLQQEANRKLGFSARQTMMVAQRLYENGHITYMRTDSIHMSDEAINGTRKNIVERYGNEYLHPELRKFSTKNKSAQEAHEAIRPAGGDMKTAEELSLSGDEGKLYRLIWKRTMATQMAQAKLNFVTVTVTANGAEFRATGKTVTFPGFFRAYVEGVDDPEAAMDDQEAMLPPLEKGEVLDLKKLEVTAHETKPPARYTEATLVKHLEAEGIGRPSTYASILSTIQNRGYVKKEGNQLIPSFTAMAVTQLLEINFDKLVDLGFTAGLEEYLDRIATGEGDRSKYLKDFYTGGDGLAQQVKDKESTIDARQACTLKIDNLSTGIRIGRFGPFIETMNEGESLSVSIPDGTPPSDITEELLQQLIEEKKQGPKPIGLHPEEDLPIFLLKGPFGHYLQLGPNGDSENKPKRVGIPKTMDIASIDLDKALALFTLPRRLGHHPETTKVVNAGIGRFGPYVVHDKKYKSLGKEYDVLTVDLDTAVKLLNEVKDKKTAEPIRVVGKHPEEENEIVIYDGRYGPYIKYGKLNVTIPKDHKVEEVSIDDAVAWIEKKAALKGGSKKKKKATKKTSKKSTKKISKKVSKEKS